MGRKRGLSDEAKWGYLLVAPTIIGLIVLNVYPFIQTLILSFSTTHPFGFYEISGIGNYVKMFSSQEFWKATWNSVYFCILTVPVGIFLALVTAVLLNAKIAGKTAFRAIYFLPMVVAPAAVAMVWKWIFNAEYGIINQILGSRVNWLTNPEAGASGNGSCGSVELCRLRCSAAFIPESRIFPKAIMRQLIWTELRKFSSFFPSPFLWFHLPCSWF